MRNVGFIALLSLLSLCYCACLEGQAIPANAPDTRVTSYPRAKYGLAGITCGETEKHRILVHNGEHPSPVPSPGKALVLVGFGSHFGKGYQHKLALDQRWVAVLNKSEYTYFEVQPGIQRFGWNVGSVRTGGLILEVNLEAGHTYYLRGTLTDLFELDEADGKRFISKLDYVTFEPEGAKPEEWWTQRARAFEGGFPQLKAGMSLAEVGTMLGVPDLFSLSPEMLRTSGSWWDSSGERVTSSWSDDHQRLLLNGECGHDFEFHDGQLFGWK